MDSDENRKMESSHDTNKVNRPLLVVIFISFLSIVAYVVKFHSHAISSAPSDWANLGNYFGGITSPLISIAALIYLAKAYYTQKTELAETRIALRDAARHSEKSALAQSQLVSSALNQETLTEKNLQLRLIALQIEVHQGRLSFLQSELSSSTRNYNEYGSTIDIFDHDKETWLTSRKEMDAHRRRIVLKIKKENIEIDNLVIEKNELRVRKSP